MRQTFKFLFAVALLAMQTPAANAQPVKLPFTPEIGAAWRVVETRSQLDASGKSVVGQQGVVVGDLKVVSKTADGYLMQWSARSVTRGNPPIDSTRPELLLGANVRFKAIGGAPVEIEGVEALIDELAKSRAAGQPLEKVEKEIAELRRLLLPAEPIALSNFLLPQASAVGGCQDFVLEEGKLITAPVTLKGVGGAPTKSTVTVQMISAGSKTEPAHIRITQTLAKGAMSGAVNSALGADTKLSPSANAALASITQSETTDCHVDRTTGETISVVINRSVMIAGNRVDTRRTVAVERLR